MSGTDTTPTNATGESSRDLTNREAAAVLTTLLVVFLTLVFRGASGALGGNPPAFYWFLPSLYVAGYAGFSSGLTDRQRLGGFLPLLAFLSIFGLALVERGSVVGKLLLHLPDPRWTLHGYLAFSFLLAFVGLRRSRGFPLHLLLIGGVAFVAPLLPHGLRDAFWDDCRDLRSGMSVAEVFDVMQDQYLLDPESSNGADRFPVRGLAPTDWEDYERLTFGHEGGNADVCWVTFRGSRVAHFVTSPD